MSYSVSNSKDLLELLAREPEAPLVFAVDGVEIKPGYHVTKLKSAKVASIDCGRQRGAWTEVVAQLFDGPVFGDLEVDANSHMSAMKFHSILKSGLNAIGGPPAGELYFEFALKNGPMRKYTAGDVDMGDSRLVVNLEPVFVTCDPAESWLVDDTDAQNESGCCGLGGPKCCSG